jgi:hypothetical protein
MHTIIKKQVGTFFSYIITVLVMAIKLRKGMMQWVPFVEKGDSLDYIGLLILP